MITFDFVQKIHKLVKLNPEKKKELQILYPEAFRKEDITNRVEFKLYGSVFVTFRLYDGETYFGEMRPHARKGFFFTNQIQFPIMEAKAGEAKLVVRMEVSVEDGYQVEFNNPGYYGFSIYRYGPDAVDLSFDPADKKNRIKGD